MPTLGMPFTASTLQIGSYHSYQHRKLKAAKVTITEPDSAVSALRLHHVTSYVPQVWNFFWLLTLRLGTDPHTFRTVVDETSKAETALSGSVIVTWAACGDYSLLSAKWKPWMASLRSATKYIQLAVSLPWSYTGALSSERGSMKMLPWTLVSVRNGRLWNVTS